MHKLIGGRVISDHTLAEFRETFLKEGWRACERKFSAKTDTLNQMIVLAGLQPKRKMKNEMVS